MEETINFLHLSDTHLSFSETTPPLCCSPARFSEAIAYADKLDGRIDFGVITGDFVHEGNTGDYRNAEDLIRRLEDQYGFRIYIGLGNHDRHAGFYEGYLRENREKDSKYYYSEEVHGVRLIVLDSAVDDEVPGRLDRRQLDWFEAQLARRDSLPTIVALHHPPCGTAIRTTNGNNLTEPDRFQSILKEYPVHAVLCGHKHFHSVTTCGRTPVVTGAGLSFGIEMPRAGKLRFTRNSSIHYCTISSDDFHWAPLNIEGKDTILEMTPQEMRGYKSHQ